ncbi:MAG: ABC transporter substrate-binding protein, partial [Mesorhizobium sp.]
MIISRRSAIKAGMAAGAVLTMPSVLRAQTAPNGRGTVRMQMNQALTVYDPVITTTTPTQNHALAIYDTLFALDSNLLPKPQMVGKWGISTDKKSYTFELRDGLSWHDGTLVTAADCVASIRRWAEVDPGGQLLMRRAKDIATKGDKTFVITLREPLGILVDILATISSGLSLYIMREKDANRPATEQVTTNIGSGPFKFNEALAKPGASFTYERNENYVPRKEPADLLAGGKVANVDRVVLEYIADSQTALSALQAGEIDYGIPPADLYSVVEEDPNLTLEVLDKRGSHLVLRMNCLQKPFNNVKARQAVLHLIDQEAMMRIAIVDPKYYRTGKSIFGDYSPYTNDENTSWFKPGGNPEKAKQLFK